MGFNQRRHVALFALFCSDVIYIKVLAAAGGCCRMKHVLSVCLPSCPLFRLWGFHNMRGLTR